MSLRTMTLGLLIASSLAAAGCVDGAATPADAGRVPADTGGSDGSADDPDSGSAAESRVYVLNMLNIGVPDLDGNVPGFDVDMHNTMTEADAIGCGFIDANSGPPDNLPGVDNQLGPVLMTLGDVSGGLQSNINDGTVLILAEVTGVNSFTNDGSINVNLYRALLVPGDHACAVTPPAPMLAADGRLAAGQTFDIDSHSYMVDGSPLISTTGRIVNGRVQAGPTLFTLNLPIMGTLLSLTIHNTQIRFDITATGAIGAGVLGGGLNVEEIVTAVSVIRPELAATIRSVLGGSADLDPDATGVCQSVSLGLVFSGVTAVKGNTVTPLDCTPDAGPPRDAGPPQDSGPTLRDGGAG